MCPQLPWVTLLEGAGSLPQISPGVTEEQVGVMQEMEGRFAVKLLLLSCVTRLSVCGCLREWNWEKEFDSIQGLGSPCLRIAECLSTVALLA